MTAGGAHRLALRHRRRLALRHRPWRIPTCAIDHPLLWERDVKAHVSRVDPAELDRFLGALMAVKPTPQRYKVPVIPGRLVPRRQRIPGHVIRSPDFRQMRAIRDTITLPDEMILYVRYANGDWGVWVPENTDPLGS